MGRVALILCSLIGANLIPARGNDGPVVQTKLGALKGASSTANGKHTVIYSYLGVPFAKPPVGPLRLAPPQPTEAWDGVRDATKQPYICLQDKQLYEDMLEKFCMVMELPEVSEDCLYLNIYTPSKPGEFAKLPVMFWIHGGGLFLGSASSDGQVLAAYQNVVVVLIQYRLGLLGFFSTGDEHAPGNYGLLDQVAALQWVQENIHSFGGDPGSVTIFGESAGGVSVSLQILSPLSAGLYRYAIAESGTAAMEAIMTTNPLPVAQSLANASGCDWSSTKKIVDCVMKLTQDDLLKIAKQFFAPPGWIDGMDREEVMSLMPFISPHLTEKWVQELVVNEYLDTTDDRIKVRDAFREMYGDLMFNIPARKVAKYHKGEFTEKENELCRTMMSYWGNFARTGSPNGPGLTPWPEHGTEAEYLGIGLEQKPGKNLKGKHYEFITEILPRIIREKKNGPVVQTKLGALKGAYSTAKGKHTIIYSYLGVPFAKPPVGPLRLAPPQPTEAWDGVRDATKQPYMCIQNMQETMSIFGNLSISVEFPEVSEDCLYLNIYTPAKPSEYANLPVLVWIHGGGFSLGSASIFDGSVLSAYENVVVVLIQYRLGLLGFFSTGDEHAPGNYGLLDQVAALQWVQENIHSFGGDSGSVTIFGESAGGISVSLLLLSPLSAGLFHRAIAESGCALMQGIVKDPLPVAQQAANMSGCDTSSTKMIAECARNWSTEHVLKFSTELMMLQFAVTEDKNFLPKPVEELLHNQEFSKVPLITGVNNDEFGWLLPNVSECYTAGVPVYLYEFQHPPSLLQASRPSFVQSDHADELLFIFGSCFGNSHMKFSAPCTEEEKELCRAMMAYWGNFARTGSPNGPGLTIWPEHGAETEYLAIGLKQKPGKNLKAKRYLFMTEKLPELMRSAQEKQEHTELLCGDTSGREYNPGFWFQRAGTGSSSPGTPHHCTLHVWLNPPTDR
ncbi:hypothetical protein P4O66_002655 [Electrophorus voltai]|uniref:Carboxylesterase type B domain-containing protein n=1 Tax=Electrophorus voltai TaxID=2609070 RepID=A0AAD8YWC1_9TELE|nr:hypothetical protein P4O66_002655 [Electrophorus voltai]